MNLEEILASLDWSSPRKVDTSKGLRMLRTAKPTAELLKIWETDRKAVQALGYSVSEYKGEVRVAEWRGLDEKEQAKHDARFAAKKDRLSKTNLRALMRAIMPQHPEEPWLSGRTEEDTKARIEEIRRFGWFGYCARHREPPTDARPLESRRAVACGPMIAEEGNAP